MRNLTLRHLLILILAPLQFVTSRWNELTGAGRSVGDMATDAPVLATPAGYAFLIWILIFALQTAYAGWQARPSQRAGVLHARIGWPLVVALLASNIWMLTAIYQGNGWALLALILVFIAAIFTALMRVLASLAADTPPTPAINRLILPMLAICAGWLTLASFLNLAGVMQLSFGLPTGTPAGGVATLLGAFVAAGATLMLLRSSSVAVQSYGCAVVWGLVAVVLANAIPSVSPLGAGNLVVAITAWLAAAAMVAGMAIVLRVRG